MLGSIRAWIFFLGCCSLVVMFSIRNVSHARRYTNLDLVMESCSFVVRSSMRNVSLARRYTNLDLVLGSCSLVSRS